MGCDIHLHVEVKIDNTWYHLAHPNVNRNYELFSKMAGVRGSEEPIAELRGLPKNATFLTTQNYAYWSGDAHSVSYLTHSEIRDLQEWLESQDQTLEEVFPVDFYDWWDNYEIRFVFWFDN